MADAKGNQPDLSSVKTTRCVDLFGTAVASALCLLPAAIRSEETKSPERIATAPSGKFYLVRYTDVDQSGASAGERLALVPAHDPKTCAPLPISEKVDANTTMGLAFFSPNEQWIFSDDTLCSARLYHRTGDLDYVQASAECLSELAWRFFAEQEKVDDKLIGMPPPNDQVGRRVIEFVDWSSDSRRLLVSLSASIGPPDKASWDFETGAAWWLCYFNTDTGKFELTGRLRAANRDARKRWKDYHIGWISKTLPLSAESVGQEEPWMPVSTRFERADKKLNNVYAALLKQLEPDARKQFQREQREWLIRRDTDAAIYANQHWGPFGAAALMEGKALSTEARVADLEKQVKPRQE